LAGRFGDPRLKADTNKKPAGKTWINELTSAALGGWIVKSVNGWFALNTRRRRSSGQSLVEIAILFPILLMLLSGIVEFGFLLNQYLNLLDGAREAARFASDGDPFMRDPGNQNCSLSLGPITQDFYNQAACLAQQVALPIQLDSVKDDVVISAFGVADGAVVARYPANPQDPPGGAETPGEWHLLGVGGGCVPTADDCNPSKFSNARIDSYLTGAAPNTGIVVVEIFFDYNQVLALPWITAFVPDPIQVHTYAIMPLVAAEPDPYPPSP
jgi:hypothetical protein